MSDSSSPTSSLLHMNRPAVLSPQSSQNNSEVDCPSLARTRSGRPISRTRSAPGFKRLCSPTASTREPNAVASASHGLAYLNVPPVVGDSKDTAAADEPSLPVAPQRQVTEALTLLTTVKHAALGEAVPREQWQPDGSSALCSYPLCTTNFGPATHFSYFSLTPRRHHCRLCGFLFCADHTTQRAQLIIRTDDGKHVSKQRVCDVCLPPAHQEPTFTDRHRRSSSCSNGSGSTVPSDLILTPEEELPLTASFSTLSSAKLRSNHRSHLDVTVLSTDDLAPVEPWMGAGGILSLYPLAVNASHACGAPAPCPAVGPLFSPSAAAKRDAQEKELQRLTLRQRRLGSDLVGCLPEKMVNQPRSLSPAISSRSSSRTPSRTRSEERVRSTIRTASPNNSFRP